MNILVVAPSFPPVANPEAFVMGKLVHALVDSGVRVTVLTAEWQGRLDPSSCWKNGLGTVLRLKPRRSLRRLSSAMAKLRWLDPNMSWFSRAAYGPCKELLSGDDFDVVLTCAPSADALYVVWKLRPSSRSRWVALFNDPLPVHLYPPPYGKGRSENFADRWRQRLVSQAVRAADDVVFPCRRLAARMQEHWGLDLSERLLVLPHIGWARPSHSSDSAVLEIVHAGGLGPSREDRQFLGDFGRLLARYSTPARQLRLVLLGCVDAGLQSFLAENQLDRVVSMEPPVPFERALERMARAQALLMIEARVEEGIFLPSKFCDYAVSGRPLLLFCPERGTIADKVGLGHPGFLTQDRSRYSARLEEFLKRLAGGIDVSDYRCPKPSEYAAEKVAGQLLERFGRSRVDASR